MLCDNADSFPRPTETFYGQTKPAQSEKGVGQWLGFSNLASAAMLAVVANTTDENTKTNVKKVMMGVSLAGALIAQPRLGRPLQVRPGGDGEQVGAPRLVCARHPPPRGAA